MEKHYRVAEVALMSGLSVDTIRKKLGRGEAGYRKGGRAVLIPESQLAKLMGTYIPAQGAEATR